MHATQSTSDVAGGGSDSLSNSDRHRCHPGFFSSELLLKDSVSTAGFSIHSFLIVVGSCELPSIFKMVGAS